MLIFIDFFAHIATRGTFFESEAARGQDEFFNINTCYMSFSGLFELLNPFMPSSSGFE